MKYLGDFAAGATVRVLLDTFDTTGAAVTFGSLAAHVLKNGSATNVTAGVTVSADFDGTGVHLVSVDLSADGTAYAVGAEFAIVVTGTVNGITVRRVIAQFSIANRSNLSAAGVRSAVGLASANLDTQLAALFTTAMTESYAADGSAPTPAQALFLIQQRLTEFAISGTTITVKKLDGSTTAATLTLDDATAPTSSTRAS